MGISLRRATDGGGGENARHTFVKENRGEMALWRWHAIPAFRTKRLPK
jgi:hypothetical protein